MENNLKFLAMIVALFILNGCTLSQLFLSNEINKINIVKLTPSTKYYRGYFPREDLKPVLNRQKYLFLYNGRRKDLALLLRHGNTYTLYHLPDKYYGTIKVRIKPNRHRKRNMLRYFAKRGYHIANPRALGYRTKTGLRKYKGIKTLMVELKCRCKSKERHGKKLSDGQEQESISYAENSDTQIEPLYSYYLHYASIPELKNYINDPRKMNSINASQRNLLKKRLSSLEKEDMLKNGSLEELIEYYKKNKDPKVKKQIMELIKQKQKQN